MILAGVAGAAVATAVVVTVYEGRVVADSHGTRSELQPGSRTTLDPGGPTRLALAAPFPAPAASAPASPSLDVEHASRAQLVTRITAQDAELAKLRARGAQPSSSWPPPVGLDGPFPDGRPWHDPFSRHAQAVGRQLRAAGRYARLRPSGNAGGERGLTADEVPEYNAAVSGVQQKFTALVRTLFIATTGDTAGADTLSLEGMIQEIQAKAPPGEAAADRATLAQERAG